MKILTQEYRITLKRIIILNSTKLGEEDIGSGKEEYINIFCILRLKNSYIL
jgi:hypothetical protein